MNNQNNNEKYSNLQICNESYDYERVINALNGIEKLKNKINTQQNQNSNNTKK